MSSARFIFYCAGFQEADEPFSEIRYIPGFALPDRKDLPPCLRECFLRSPVPFLVPANLDFPKIAIGGRERGPGTVMPVPEAAVNEYHALSGWKDKVGSAGKIFTVKTIAVTEPMNEGADRHLQSGVFAPDAGHVAAALLGRNSVHAPSVLSGGQATLGERLGTRPIREDEQTFAAAVHRLVDDEERQHWAVLAGLL